MKRLDQCPSQQASTDYVCCICGRKIFELEMYRYGGRDRKAHSSCAVFAGRIEDGAQTGATGGRDGSHPHQ